MELKKRWPLLFISILLLFSLVGCKEKGSKVEDVDTSQQVEEKEVVEKDQEKEVETNLVKLEDVTYLDKLEGPIIKVPFNKTEISPKLDSYKIEGDFSNVKNIEYFGDFTEDQKEALVENAFVISKTGVFADEYGEEPGNEFTYDQIHQIYEANEYKGIPSFVTTDSVTHIFHIFYDGFLRDLEKNELYPKSVDLTSALLKANIEIYNKLENDRIKDLQLKNVAYFAVGANTLGIGDIEVPKEAKEIIEKELANIEGKAVSESAITGGDIDYSQMTVRGHYTRDEILEKYFLNTMYYSQIGLFPMNGDEVNEDAILQAMLITHSIYNNPDLVKLWSDLVEPIDFLVETPDDLSPKNYSRILYSVYGKDPDLNMLGEKDKLAKSAELISDLPKPLIAPFKGMSFRLVPQRAVMDNVLMQNVVDIADLEPSERPIYSALDLMTAFGNEKAKEILYANDYNSHWDEYKDKTEENISTIKAFADEDWQKNLYRGWLWMLQSYNQSFGPGYPTFMQNEAWAKKDLVSALGSYAELKHDTVLYGKPVMAEMGGGGLDDIPKGYVEPNLELYEKLNWLLEYTKVNLKERDMLNESRKENLLRFQSLVKRLIDLTKKELTNEAFTKEDYIDLYYIGGEMEGIMVNFVESDDDEYGISYWYEIENATDRRMPVVVDLMTVVENVCGLEPGKIASIATGRPAEIYVIYPQDGELYMGRGGIFTFHEFLADERLTDEKWQETLLNEEVEVPAWYNDILHEEKPEFEGNTEIAW